MLIVQPVERGVVEVNYMWLPAWMGMNSLLITQLGKHLQDRASGKSLDDSTLLDLHYEAIRFLQERFPEVEGLHAYLQGIQNIRFKNGEEGKG